MQIHAINSIEPSTLLAHLPSENPEIFQSPSWLMNDRPSDTPTDTCTHTQNGSRVIYERQFYSACVTRPRYDEGKANIYIV